MRVVHQLGQPRLGGAVAREMPLTLSWNIAVWLGFIIGTEFFVAYKSEGPFRELWLSPC